MDEARNPGGLAFADRSLTESSHDLLADRRFAWAAALTAEGDHAGAADLLEQVVERVPAWAPAWAALAEARTRLGRAEAALAAWREAAVLDNEGRLGATLQVAYLSGETPKSMPSAYIRAVFDDYTPRFERHLVGTLNYRGPELVAAALDAVAPRRTFERVLDLGCGTGLMAGALQDRASAIHGVDLSPRMIDAARRTGFYARLESGSLDAALAQAESGRYDLVVAADVLVYVGDLAPVMAGVADTLMPGGLFAFTAQTRTGAGFGLGADLRFAHAQPYVETSLETAGLDLLWLDPASARTESGFDVPGLVAVARRA